MSFTGHTARCLYRGPGDCGCKPKTPETPPPPSPQDQPTVKFEIDVKIKQSRDALLAFRKEAIPEAFHPNSCWVWSGSACTCGGKERHEAKLKEHILIDVIPALLSYIDELEAQTKP